jgi:Chlorite dismutase
MSDTPEKPAHGHGHGHGAEPEAPLDVRERGAARQGEPQLMDRRLFMQLLAFETSGDPAAEAKRLGGDLRDAKVPSVVYADVNHPRGLAVLTWSEDPSHFVVNARPVFSRGSLTPRPEFSMLARTYSSGFEPDLEFWLLKRPVETVLNEAWPWAVWYPLRRKGTFNRLDGREQGGILREHGTIGHRYGSADLAHDVRLACHGLDANDNEFVVGLVGRELYPLSHVVQAMRKTRQTAEFMEHMGPFFVGHVVWRNG